MMKKIEDYVILENDSPYDLAKEVIKYVNEYDYELLGAPFYRKEKGLEGQKYEYVCQAVVKYIGN